MKTDVITVSSRGGRMDQALAEVDKAAAYKGLSGKDALHLRLLTEEMMGMMRAVTDEVTGRFWMEDEDGEYRLHLQAVTRMNSEKREQLLSAASTGKNESARGLMGRLRDFFDRGMDEDVASVPNPLLMPDAFEHTTTPTLDWEWSMIQYADAVSAGVARNEKGAKEAWDELEKSVVTHVADDVKVSIRGRNVEMVIIKRLDDGRKEAE